MASLPQDLALAVRRASRSPRPVQVHNLRVVIRRFNQAVALNSQNRSKTARSESKEIMRRAGDVRNLDITIRLVAKLKETKVLQAKLRRRRVASARRLTDLLKTWSPPEKPPEAAHANSRQAAVHAIQRLFRRGAEAHRPKDLHRVRIAAKKLRYTLEMVAPGTPKSNRSSACNPIWAASMTTKPRGPSSKKSLAEISCAISSRTNRARKSARSATAGPAPWPIQPSREPGSANFPDPSGLAHRFDHHRGVFGDARQGQHFHAHPFAQIL